MKNKIALILFLAACACASASIFPARYLRATPVAPKPAVIVIEAPAPVFAAVVVPVSIALYITKPEYIATLKKKADNANLSAQIAGLSVGPGFGWGGPASERQYGKEEGLLEAMDYAAFLRN